MACTMDDSSTASFHEQALRGRVNARQDPFNRSVSCTYFPCMAPTCFRLLSWKRPTTKTAVQVVFVFDESPARYLGKRLIVGLRCFATRETMGSLNVLISLVHVVGSQMAGTDSFNILYFQATASSFNVLSNDGRL